MADRAWFQGGPSEPRIVLPPALVVSRSYSRKLWVPYDGFRWPPPRLVQLLTRLRHAIVGHPWGRWRVETETWFDYVDEPVAWAWRGCHCGALERVRETADG